MRTFKFVWCPEQDKILNEVVRLCAWFESDTGFYSLLHARENHPLGNSLESKFLALCNLLHQLFNSWPEADFLIDLREWKYPIDAYHQIHAAIELIERERDLAEGVFLSKVFILSGTANDQETIRAFEAWNEMGDKNLIEKLITSKPIEINSLAVKFAALGL